jgi:hypothetical protein
MWPFQIGETASGASGYTEIISNASAASFEMMRLGQPEAWSPQINAVGRLLTGTSVGRHSESYLRRCSRGPNRIGFHSIAKDLRSNTLIYVSGGIFLPRVATLGPRGSSPAGLMTLTLRGPSDIAPGLTP